jgi:hypothetical protein
VLGSEYREEPECVGCCCSGLRAVDDDALVLAGDEQDIEVQLEFADQRVGQPLVAALAVADVVLVPPGGERAAAGAESLDQCRDGLVAGVAGCRRAKVGGAAAGEVFPFLVAAAPSVPQKTCQARFRSWGAYLEKSAIRAAASEFQART